MMNKEKFKKFMKDWVMPRDEDIVSMFEKQLEEIFEPEYKPNPDEATECLSKERP